MTKKKKILNGIIFLVGLIVFLFYYFEDNADMEAKEQEQDVSAEKSTDSIFEVFEKEEFENIETEQDSAMMQKTLLQLIAYNRDFKYKNPIN